MVIRLIQEHKLIAGLTLYLAMMALLSSIAYFSNLGGIRESMKPVPQGTTVYSLERLSLNVAASGNGHGTARLGINLEVARKDLDRLQAYIPRIMDRIQAYMRQILLDELRNPTGLAWLRADLLREVNRVSGPVRIQAVTFRELVLT